MYPFLDVTDPLLSGVTIEDPPAETLIEAAQSRIMSVLDQATFVVDEDGHPVSPSVRERLRQATAAQVLAWHRWGINPLEAGKERVKSTAALGPASVSYDFRDNYAASFGKARDDIDPVAYRWLRPLLQQPAY